MNLQKPVSSALAGFLFALLVALSACSSSADQPNPVSSSASITFTDAPTDELSVFEVDVSNVSIRHANGNTVSLLQKRARIDFMELTSLSDLIAGVGLPIGIYTSMTLTFDFSQAVVILKDKTTAATVVDGSGSPITGSVDVTVDFAVNDRPRMVLHRNHLFVLDLDLDQGLTVDATNNKVTFEPVLGVEVDPATPRTVVATGFLDSVNTSGQTFVLEKRAVDGSRIGTYRVKVPLLSVFQVDGVVKLGSAGLSDLAKKATGTTRVYVQGTLDRNNRTLNAAAVEAGSGTFGNGQDWVIGHIVARNNAAGSDAALTVLGRSRDVSSGTRTFNTSHTVNVHATQTKVLRRGAVNSLNADALNVGQHVVVFGDLSGTTLDATARSAVARMVPTSVWGVANGAVSGFEVSLNVSRIGLRPISSFNFSVGGSPEAVPTAFTVNTGLLNTSGITTGTKIRAIGWVNPVGLGGDANFQAASLVNQSTTARVLLCAWAPASATAFSAIGSSAINLDVSSALIKSVGDGFGPTTLANSPTPMIKPKEATGVYRIVQGRAVQVHYKFDSFATALQSRIDSQNPVSRVGAFGTFDETAQVLEALIVTVVLN